MASSSPKNGHGITVTSISDPGLNFNQFLDDDGHWKWTNRNGVVALDWAPDGTVTLMEPGSGGVWTNLATYSTGALVIDRGGTWQATGTNTNSRPISGNTDWTLIAGTPFVDVTLDPVALTTAPFYSPVFIISAVDQGAKQFTVFSSPVGFLTAGATVTVKFSTGNDGLYTVASVTATTIVVNEAIPDATGDGSIYSGSGLFFLPGTPGKLLASPAVYLQMSDGSDWGNGAFVAITYGDLFGNTVVWQSSSPNILSNAGFWTQQSGQNNQANNLDEIGQGLVMSTADDMSVGGTVIGTRSATIRFFYQILSVPPFP